MDKMQKILLITGLLLLVFGIGITVFVNIAYSDQPNSSNITIWIIMTSQFPIWISLIAKSHQNRKKKESVKAKNVYQPEDANYFTDKFLSDEGEIISYDDIEEARHMKNRNM